MLPPFARNIQKSTDLTHHFPHFAEKNAGFPKATPDFQHRHHVTPPRGAHRLAAMGPTHRGSHQGPHRGHLGGLFGWENMNKALSWLVEFPRVFQNFIE